MKRFTRIVLGAACALVLFSGPPATAATLSPDLLIWLQNGYELDDQLQVIVQLREPLSEKERVELFSRASAITEFPTLEMVSLTISARELPRWAANPRVFAIDLDREVRALAPAASLI